MRSLCILVVALGLAGCSQTRKPARREPPPPAPSTLGSARTAATSDITGAMPVERQTSHQPGKVKPYRVSADLREVTNLKAFTRVLPLTEGQRALLAKQLFAASHTGEKQLFWIYENNEYHNLPSFVTTDVAVHLYHCFFDYALRSVEQEKLLPLLQEMTSALLAETARQLRSARKAEVRSALVKNAAYFATAAKLLALPDPVPGAAQPAVNKELSLVNGHAGYGVGAVFPYKVDYSQFVPRGHYTRSAKLKRFFMCMMWYGLTPFATRFADGTPSPDTVRQGVLMARTVDAAGMLLHWNAIYEPTTFFVGKSDDHIPAQWIALSNTVFGRDALPDAVADRSKLEQFTSEVEKLPTARIRAKMIGAREMPSPISQLRLMGQRYIPDSEVLQRLSAPLARPFPSGLDVMGVIGSQRALQILDAHPEVYNANRWTGYRPERSKVAREFAAIPARRWTSNLYWSWLNTLQPLLDRIPDGYPSFMSSEAWRDKSLNTALASWAELRHDTVLYGKQSAVECGDGEERPTPTGYVEPNVPVYELLLRLVKRTRALLEKSELMTDRLKTGFEEFGGLLEFLRRCSLKELRGETLSQEDNLEIRYIGGKIEFLTRSTIEGQPQYWELVDKGDNDMAVVADVHTAPPKVLEEGVGRAAEILVIVPIGKKLVLTRGAILTYFEFTHPIDDRLTDEKWRALLGTDQAPDPPAWTKTFLLPAAPKDPNREKKESYSSGC